MSYASAGSGSTAHLSIELLKLETGIELVHVPYRGGTPALTDVMSGQVPLMTGGMPTALAHVKAGRLRALEAGATDFLNSPVDHHEFVTRARNLLKLRQQQLELEARADVLERKLEDSEKTRAHDLRDSRERLAQVIDTVPVMISAASAEGRVLFINRHQVAFIACVDKDFRFDRRRVAMTMQWVQAVLACVLALVVASGEKSAYTLSAIVFLQGCASSLGNPAFQAMIPLLVPREELLGALALSGMTWNSGRAVGPMLAAITTSVWGPAASITGNAISFDKDCSIIAASPSNRRPHPAANNVSPVNTDPSRSK